MNELMQNNKERERLPPGGRCQELPGAGGGVQSVVKDDGSFLDDIYREEAKQQGLSLKRLNSQTKS